MSVETDRILSPAEVTARTSLSRTTLWRLARDTTSDFPRPIRLSPGRIGWSASSLDRYLADRQAPAAA